MEYSSILVIHPSIDSQGRRDSAFVFGDDIVPWWINREGETDEHRRSNSYMVPAGHNAGDSYHMTQLHLLDSTSHCIPSRQILH